MSRSADASPVVRSQKVPTDTATLRQSESIGRCPRAFALCAVAALRRWRSPLPAQAQAAPASRRRQPALPGRRSAASRSRRRARSRRPASGPVVLFIAPCFEAQGNAVARRAADLPLLHPAEAEPRRREGVWVPYDDADREDDPRRLPPAVEHQLPRQPLDRDAATTRSRTASIGKIVTYNMEERQRVKIVDYVGSKKVETSKIDEKLKEANARDPPRHLHRSRRSSGRSKASSAT